MASAVQYVHVRVHVTLHLWLVLYHSNEFGCGHETCEKFQAEATKSLFCKQV